MGGKREHALTRTDERCNRATRGTGGPRGLFLNYFFSPCRGRGARLLDPDAAHGRAPPIRVDGHGHVRNSPTARRHRWHLPVRHWPRGGGEDGPSPRLTSGGRVWRVWGGEASFNFPAMIPLWVRVRSASWAGRCDAGGIDRCSVCDCVRAHAIAHLAPDRCSLWRQRPATRSCSSRPSVTPARR